MSKLKICVAGAGGVGKSALCIQFVRGRFVTSYDPTVEDIFQKVTEVDGESRMLEIVDTAGQEEYKTLRDIYFKESDGFILVYSITSQSSFAQAQRLRDRLSQMHGNTRPIILAGNKLDLASERQVAEEEAYQYAVGQQVGFFECSAKTMTNVVELFCGIVRLIERQKKVESSSGDSGERGKGDSSNNNNNSNEAPNGGRRKISLPSCVLL